MCSTCATVYAHVKNRIEVVQQAMMDLCPDLMSGGSVQPLPAELIERLGLPKDAIATAVTERLWEMIHNQDRELLDATEVRKVLGLDPGLPVIEYLQSIVNDRSSTMKRMKEMRSLLGAEDPTIDAVAALRDLVAAFDQYRSRCESLVAENTVFADRISFLEGGAGMVPADVIRGALLNFDRDGSEIDPIRDALVDFSLKVLAGRVSVVHSEEVA